MERAEEPSSVKEILVELMEKSELIVDLAYSAVIFDSEDMADEVLKIEEEVERLVQRLNTLTILSARSPKEAEQVSGIIDVGYAAKSMANAAGDIVELLETDIERRPFLPFLFEEADEKIHVVFVSEDSDLVHRRIGDLKIEAETGVRVIAIKRGKHWLYDPEGEVRIKPGDALIIRGTEDGFEFLNRVAMGEEKWD
jgi:uncharacterized protein with PhoU and TrkA domain